MGKKDRAKAGLLIGYTPRGARLWSESVYNNILILSYVHIAHLLKNHSKKKDYGRTGSFLLKAKVSHDVLYMLLKSAIFIFVTNKIINQLRYARGFFEMSWKHNQRLPTQLMRSFSFIKFIEELQIYRAHEYCFSKRPEPNHSVYRSIKRKLLPKKFTLLY
jgi:hypothetical protein